MRTKGFTLIEVMIVVAIIGILAAVILPKLTGVEPGELNVQQYTPPTPAAVYREECISGYKFVISDGKAVQIFDDAGKGVKCP